MFFSHSTKNKNELFGLIDIGSSQINAISISLKEQKIENFSEPITKRIPFQELPDFDYFWTTTKQSLQSLMADWRNKDEDKSLPNRFFIFLSSPFFQSQNENIKIQNKEPVKITKNYLTDIIKKQNADKTSNKDIIILEDKITRIKLDGYLTEKPFDQKATEIAFSRFLSWTDKKIISELKQLIQAEQARASVTFNTFPFVVYDTFRRFLPDKDFILLDTGNEITDILIIRDGVLVEHFSFPKGKNFLVRNLAKNLNTIPAEIETSLELYLSNQANPRLKSDLDLALNQIAPLWQKDWKEALGKALETTFLPETIYLISDELTDSLFANFINQSDLQEITLSNNKINVILAEKLLAEALNQSNSYNSPITNNWLLAEALFCARLA